ncbi:amidohydrolase family protein, partial [Nocardia aurea]
DLPYQLFDADNHLYETKDALTRHLPKQYEGAIQYIEINGRTKIAVLGQISEYIPNPTFDVVARPGAMEDYFKYGNPEGKSRREIFGKSMKAIDAFRDPVARLKVMDDLQLQRALMFPTLASLVEERMRHHPELIHAVIHSLNEWMLEEWGQDGNFVHSDRIFTIPVITLPIVEKAIEELNWAVVEHGAKAILVRPAPVPGLHGMRSFALPEFDPFWKRVVELDVLV